MKKTKGNNLAPYLSPIIIHNGLLRGCAFIPGTKPAQVAVLIDGKILTKVFCEFPIADIYRESLGGPAGLTKGFLVPLPARLFDGAPHELITRLCKPDRKTVESTASDLAQYWLLESRLAFQHGDRHGQVSFVDGHFQGWVAFSHRPTPLPQLILSDQEGNFCKQIPLIPLPTENGQPNKYLANFRIPQKNLPLPLRIFCGEIELTGSPCQPKKKLIGHLERFNAHAIHGWAFDMNQPTNPVELTLIIDGQTAQHFRPNVYRPDVANHLKLPEEGLGIIGFQLTPPEILFDGKEHRISVEFTGLNHPLRGSGQLVKIPKNYLTFDEIVSLPKRIVRQARKIARPNKPVVSVIILNRNGEKLLAALFESWKIKNSLTNVEFIVVDHASDDGSLGLLNRWQSQLPLHIIPLSFNDSFSASCNRAAEEARGKFLLFLNNDIIWLQDVLPTMVDTLENDQKIGVLGLKLIKSTDNKQLFGQPLVQHLGVRFKLSHVAYWPYEATPDDNNEAEYSTQTVPAVTGAVMLCRKKDFFHVGKFDPSYFYGFEDVEFCLRLSNRLDKKIICRNDLLALHHHGYTRLSGRARDITDRLINNADVLQTHAGLWLKQRYWTSLFNADQHLTVDKPTVGFIVDEPLANGKTTHLRSDASKLAKQVLHCYPSVQIVFLPPSRGWYNIRNIHILIVGHPEYDIGKTIFCREDLLTLAWIRDDADLWSQAPWWPHFDGYLAAKADAIKYLAPTVSSPIVQTTAATPLGPLFNPQSPPLRVALLMPHKISAQHKTRIDTLQQSLKAAGAVVWQDPFDTPDGSTRLADIRIAICFNKSLLKIEPEAQPHTLNILWAPYLTQTQSTENLIGWQIVNQMPQVDWLRNELEKEVGNTFCSS
ncbi:glycosyltransferase family 2 protein [Nitrosomonas sp. Is37]|uniref:glycosyltransferase family 2 protein n=1 Tax=Nitrosomonas sp. Is37 TaxID=3080535 RepID=UPI00294B363E|nr:glycosyltransferase [Nitrosomonas sp. Is37]MDV6344289.1 glycosyltransferase [Nitrosomonas sp. Is37]